MKASYLGYWFPRVVAALKANHGSHRASNFAQFARDVSRHDKQVRKDFGQIKQSLHDEDAGARGSIPDSLKRYSYAAVLGVPESDLSPDNPTLIAGAAILLVRWHLGREVGDREARAYGGYIATNPRAYEVGPDDEGHLDDEAVRRVHRDMPGDWKSGRELERAILEVARAVGEVLLLDKFASLVERAPRRSTSRRGGV